jgi:F0F1-type ATP synthase membrane subunit b/b'
VAELAIQLAEKVVERNLDRDTNTALIDSFIRQVGAQS